MKQFLARKRVFWVVLLLIGMMAVSSASFAASRSVTARISCTVVPMIEITSQTLLSNESLVDRGGQKVKLVSVTAL
jgi:hypothetical protein